jgi:dihydrofolate reductase
MAKVVVANFVSLDGVMQGPGRPDEDTRGGFTQGGWGIPYGDEATVAKMGERMGEDRAFLFGRHTYEQLLTSWNARGGPFKDALNETRKFVASSNPATDLEWPNSTLLHGDVPAAVSELKRGSETNLVIMGSGVLIGSLMSGRARSTAAGQPAAAPALVTASPRSGATSAPARNRRGLATIISSI